MTDPLARLRRFLSELKRRSVYRVAVTYAVVAFVVVQAADLLFRGLEVPSWVFSALVVLVVLGFPIALVLAWAFEMTPEGVRRTPAAEPVEEKAGAPSAERRGRFALKLLVGLGLVGAAVAGGWYLMGGGGESPDITERTVVVLPFEVSGSGAEDWRDGMVSLLSTGLDGAAGLRAIADRTVFAAWEESPGTQGGASTEEALSVARQIGAQYAIVGSAAALGSELQLAAQVRATESGTRLGQVEVRGAPDSVTALAHELTRRVVGVLAGETGEELRSADLASVTTPSLPALKAYLEGERHFRAGEFRAAVADYRDAVERDSTFALAYARLAASHGWLAEFEIRADYLNRAYELSHRLPRRERRLLRAAWLSETQGQAVPALDSLRRLVDAYPDEPAVWYELGDAIFHASLPGGWPEADEAFQRAVELDPGHSPYRIHHLNLAVAFHHDSALAARRAADHPHPQSVEPWFPLAMGLVFGTPERRRQARARVDAIDDPLLLAVTLLHPEDGDLHEAVLRKLRELPLVPQLLVQNLLRRGRLQEALASLQEAPPADAVACGLSDALSLGFPVPDSLLRGRLDPSTLGEDASLRRLLCAGVYLVERGRTAAMEQVVRRISEAVADTAAQGGWSEPHARDAVDVLRGYRAWKVGELERGARLLARSVHEHVAVEFSWRGLWRGDIYRALGELEKAEGWYLGTWWHPLAHQRLGRLYEEMGQPEKAAAAYRRFIEAWKDADPELQPRVEEARKRLQQLTVSKADSDD